MEDLSLYLHIPFCSVRCAYCDFNTYAGLDDQMAPYAHALAKEIRLVGRAGGRRRAHTIFLGGGTPSLMPLALQAEIFAAIRESFDIALGCEITLEANPGTISRDYLEGLRELGVNRLSFGAQSSHPAELRLLDRLHLFGDVVQAVTWARQAGFDNLNLDLIFGIPHQTEGMWRATLNRVVALGPEHIACYALSLEHGTPMRAWVHRGLLPMPDADLAADMYALADELLAASGYRPYEISNWARDAGGPPPASMGAPVPSFACRHNLQYWRSRPYLGFGAGAHGCAGGWRYSNVLAPGAYIARLKEAEASAFPFSPAAADRSALTRADEMGEMMLMGLRLVGEGVASADFEQRHGVTLAGQYGAALRRLKQLGLIEWDEAAARLTSAGRLVGNRVFREFV